MSRVSCFAVFVACAALAACGQGSGGAASTSASSSAAKSAPKPVASAPKPASSPAEPAVAFSEVDLSPRGAEWKGFTIKAPSTAKVMDDLGDCRVAEKGFDVVLSQKPDKSDVAARKKALEELAKTAKGKVTFSNETADGFDYKLETPKFDKPTEFVGHDSFFTVVKVGGKKVGCFPHDSAMGDEIGKAREACKTVAKK